MARSRFVGAIAGIGTASGTRIVVGRWTSSPLGPFADVMVEQADGRRLLLAASHEVAEFVRLTYTFDEIVRTPVLVESSGACWRVDTDWWATAIDPVARTLLRGTRTRGSAGHGRREWYLVTDLHRITAASGSWCEEPLGDLRQVEPPVRFGFGSTPRRPSLTQVVTIIEH